MKTLITSKLGTLKNRLGDSSPASTEKSNATKQSNTTKKLTKQRLTGDIAEATALEYLQNRGLALVEKNYLCKCGEIDLIMSDRRLKETNVVFVEVRYRNKHHFGGGLESITPAKQEKLRRTAQLYLQIKRARNLSCRFDVVSISGSLKAPQIQWIENAF